MALGKHPDVRTDPHELCPFCGCGLTAAATGAKRSRPVSRSSATARTYTLATGRVIPLKGRELAFVLWRETHPVSRGLGVGFTPGATRAHTPAELAAIAAADAYMASHRGMVAIVDEKRNTISGWRPAAGASDTAAA